MTMGTRKPRTVLVTGGGRGIGRAIALAFGAIGHRVVITGRTEPVLDCVAEEIRRLGADAFSKTCDITERAQVEELGRAVKERLGPVEVLINNAGTAAAASFLEMEDSFWEQVLRVNLTGTYNCCKVLLPDMLAARWGRIINIASIVAKVAYPHVSAYVTAKHAVLGLTRALAIEIARSGVTVNALCPGYVDTDLTRTNALLLAEKTGKSRDEAFAMLKSVSPQKRFIEPEEVARMTVMLASDSAKGITGQAINVDGGTVMS